MLSRWTRPFSASFALAPACALAGCGLLTGDAFDVSLAAADASTIADGGPPEAGSDGARPQTPIRFIQASSTVALTERATSISCAFGGPVTPGNAVVVAAQFDAPVTKVSDGFNTYALAVSANNQSSNIAIYYATNVAAATREVRFDFAAPVGAVLSVHEYSGIAAEQALDQTSGATGTGTALSSGPVTTTFAHEVLFAFGRANSGLEQTAGTGFAWRQAPGGNLSEDRVVKTASTYDATFKASASSEWAAIVATFRGAD